MEELVEVVVEVEILSINELEAEEEILSTNELVGANCTVIMPEELARQVQEDLGTVL